MNKNIESFVVRAHQDQSGQIFVWVALMTVVLLGFVALVIDMGRLYYSYRLLQNSTDAAALAGAQAMPNSTAAIAAATQYSGVSGSYNAYSNLPNVTMVSGYPKLRCLTSTTVGLPCLDSSGNIVTSGGANAIQVMQTVSVPMTFAALLGVKPITLRATALAAMRGAARAPYNVAIIVDSTASMQSGDTDGLGCSGTKESCALQGVRTLMGELSPCGASLSSCGTATTTPGTTNSNVSNPIDEISLLTFPSVSSASPDYCGGGGVSVQAYPLPAVGSTPTSPPPYQIVGFSSDYRASDGTSTLSTSSNLVKAAGGGSCAGIQDPGGEGTYYPAAIYTAASLLLSNQSIRNPNDLATPPTQNALIILGDGDANATYSKTNPQLASSASQTATTYPSYKDQCQQAITAAKWAISQGITVFSVAYASQNSGTCSTDTSASPPVNEAGITACQTMQQLASSASKFYTSNNGCSLSGGNTTMSLNAIFTAISSYMTVARLLPNNMN